VSEMPGGIGTLGPLGATTEPVGAKVVAGRRPAIRQHPVRSGESVLVLGAGSAAIGIVGAVLAGTAGWLSSATAVVVAGLWAVLVLVSPRYERLESLRPVGRLLRMTAFAVLAAVIAFPSATTDLRHVALVAGYTLLVPIAVGTLTSTRDRRRTVLVGDPQAVTHLVTQWNRHPHVDLVGVCLPAQDTPELASPGTVVGAGRANGHRSGEPVEILGVPVIGSIRDVATIAIQADISRVVVTPGHNVSAYDVRRLSWALEDTGVELSVALEAHGVVPRRAQPRLLGRRLIMSVAPPRPTRVAKVIKATIDRLIGCILLVLTAPLILGLLVAVRLTSPGPGLFRQVRIGQHGRQFRMYKLRTMSVDAEQRLAALAELNEGAGPLFKMAGDPRVTRLGRLLRLTSLDELPQLVNVVFGQMSLIGPRPALPEETQQYDEWTRRRLMIKPGMTGSWQVSGRSSLAWHEAVRLDLDYVDNWTVTGDFGIAARTVNAVIRHDGAL
jgi:exopolysaccharide biosynthesis polyprenyl glycosylphosphotransferase